MTDAPRDDVIDRWLKRATAGVAGPGPNAACLDAEVMAAWADGGLSADALAVVRAHVADCARCQVLAAVMTKLGPVGASAATPAPARRWFLWVGPLAAAAGALAIWVFVPRETALKEAAPVQMAQGRFAEAPAATPAPAAPAETARAPGARAAVGETQARKLEVAPPAPTDLKRQAAERDQKAAANVARADELRDKDRNVVGAEPKKATAAPARPAAVPPAAAAAPPPAQVADAAARMEQSARLAANEIPKEIVSSDPLVRWRTRGALLEKTADSGKTWAEVTTGIKAQLTAGASPSPDVCWVVGRGGVVLLTTDGFTWRRLSFPETTDLSAVRATDGRTATVTTADGREFSTIDGGNAWIRRLLQED